MSEPIVGIVAQTPESTVVAEWTPLNRADDAYQSEADLEAELIATLQNQAYERLMVITETT